MTADDFRRIALSLPGAEESSHRGAPDFRVGGRVFATLAARAEGFGNLMLDPERQALFLEDRPNLFLPVQGGWGRMGRTHLRLTEADADVLTGALHTAWRHRTEKNASGKKKSRPATTSPASRTQR